MFNSLEQYIQSEKAHIFDDDATHYKIMKEKNPYKIKKLGSKVHDFNLDQWQNNAKHLAYKANYAKFSQNPVLKNILLVNNTKIVKSSTDPYWARGLYLHNRNALDPQHWLNESGGVMSEILSQVHCELQPNT